MPSNQVVGNSHRGAQRRQAAGPSFRARQFSTLLRIVDPDFRSKALEDYGIAYVFISMVELAIVSILPSVVALGFVSGNFWYTLIPGAAMVTVSVLLLVITARKYGLQSNDGASCRVAESNVHEEEVQ